MKESQILSLERPFAVHPWSYPRVLVADFGNGLVFEQNMDTEERLYLTSSEPSSNPPLVPLFKGPHHFSVSPEGALYVTDYRASKIFRYEPNLTFDRLVLDHSTQPWDWLLKGPATCAYGPDHCLWVSDYGSHSIQKYSKEGVFQGWLGINENNLLSAWSKSGHPCQSVQPGGFDRVHAVEFFDDYFVAVDTWNSRLQFFTYDGKPLKQIHGFQLPVAISRCESDFWISDVGSHKIIKMNRSGDILQVLEGYKKPYDVKYSKDLLLVADSDHHRVQILSGDSPGASSMMKRC